MTVKISNFLNSNYGGNNLVLRSHKDIPAFKSGKMGANDMVLVHDGNNVAADKQLAQLTGTITEQTFTATTNKVI